MDVLYQNQNKKQEKTKKEWQNNKKIWKKQHGNKFKKFKFEKIIVFDNTNFDIDFDIDFDNENQPKYFKNKKYNYRRSHGHRLHCCDIYCHKFSDFRFTHCKKIVDKNSRSSTDYVLPRLPFPLLHREKFFDNNDSDNEIPNGSDNEN